MASFSVVVIAFVLLLALCGNGAVASRIVAIPHPGGTSHVFIMAKICSELASRGHDVTLIVAEMDAKHAESRTQNTAVKVLPFDAGYDHTRVAGMISQCTRESPLQCSVTITETCIGACRAMLKNTEAQAALSGADLVIADMSHACGYVVADLFNIPGRVDVSPVGFYDPWGAMHWGVPSSPAIVPQLGSKLTNKMTFGERVTNTIVQLVLYAITPQLDAVPDAMRTELNINRTHTESARSSGMYLVNVDWATEFPRPISPVTKVVGPILPEPPKPLPDDLAEWVESAPNGVLIVSLGTLAEVVLTPEITQLLADSFSKLNVRVLWKLTVAIPTNVGANVRIVKWFPQNDLLGHPNVKAFFTHGGMNSVQESAYHGVPMLGFPLFADQFDNVLRVVASGTAIQVLAEDFTAENMDKALDQLLNNKQFTENAKKISARMQDRKRTSTQESADWIEFALNHESGRYMRVPSLDMPAYQANNLDVIALFVAILFGLFYGFYRLLGRFVGRDSALAVVLSMVGFLIYKTL